MELLADIQSVYIYMYRYIYICIYIYYMYAYIRVCFVGDSADRECLMTRNYKQLGESALAATVIFHMGFPPLQKWRLYGGFTQQPWRLNGI